MEYIPISIIGLLFLTGCTAIIYSIFFEIERPAQYSYKPRNKIKEEIILDIGLLSGIDINDNSDVHAEFDEVN